MPVRVRPRAFTPPATYNSRRERSSLTGGPRSAVWWRWLPAGHDGLDATLAKGLEQLSAYAGKRLG